MPILSLYVNQSSKFSFQSIFVHNVDLIVSQSEILNVVESQKDHCD